MELLLLHVMVLLYNTFDFSSGVTYNKGDMEQYFACASHGFPQKDEIIKLYLSSEDLKIQCFFQSESEITSGEFLGIFTSGGLAPSLGIINSTYTGIFHFNLTLFSHRVSWLIDIPRENITKNVDIAAVEEWLVRITLQHGLNIYTTEGTLLDRVREPILQWKLGTVMTKEDVSKVYPHVVGLKVAKCPCANDVALLGFLLNSTIDGVYIGLSFSGFWKYDDTVWYNLTDAISSEVGEELTELSVVDMVLTNHFLVILTSLGLFISGDLRYPSSPVLMFSRAHFCGFERVDYVKGKLWYNERCFANREHFEVDYVTVTFERNRTLSEASSCFYSKEPFLEWLPCLPHISKKVKTVHSTIITFLVDQEHSSGVYLRNNQKNTTVYVHALKNNQPRLRQRFPPFTFPSSFSSPVGMVFHPRSHFLYAYGNQVWLSIDGGNTFELLADFHGDIIKNTYHSFYTSDITFVSQSGKVYLTKAGLERYTEIGSITDTIFTLYYDHMGFIHKLTPDRFEAGGSLAASGNSRGIFGQAPDMGFETALALQYITLTEVIFFAYVPTMEPKESTYTKKFNNMHLGKVIHSRKTGTAYIKKILQHNTPEGFLSSVIAEVIDPFGIEDVNESSCLSSSLSINQDGNLYKLTLQMKTPGATSSFRASDVEKTVVIPGYSSFLITSVVDDTNALAIATMPGSVPDNKTFVNRSWFLYNFGQRHGRTWAIYAKPCNYWFQQRDSSLSLSVLKYIDLGKSQVLKIKVIPNTKGDPTLEIPLLKVIVGNPTLLEVKVEGSFDYTDSYLMEISATSKALRQGSTSLAFIVWGASVNCFVTTFVPTLKSSCSYLKSMHHIPSNLIPMEDWIRGVRKDSQGFNMIKTLPINYRPPSNMGIAIPLTDNFYHADPSKPIPRNLFRKSKKSGKFKQCANVSTREACNCTNDQKFSYAVAFSDCREKVPRFKFPVTQYPISLEIYSEDGHTPVETPYLVTVMEVNQRGNWELKHTVPENVKKLKDYLESILHAPVYNPSGLNLNIKKKCYIPHCRISLRSPSKYSPWEAMTNASAQSTLQSNFETLFLEWPSELSLYPKSDNEVRELATIHLPWQHCTNNSVKCHNLANLLWPFQKESSKIALKGGLGAGISTKLPKGNALKVTVVIFGNEGSELFHFRVSVVPGVTFCNLVEEFQIYIDETPLPFPGHTLIAVGTAVVLGGFIFVIFILQIHNIHPWDKCKQLFRRNKVHVSNASASQLADRGN